MSNELLRAHAIEKAFADRHILRGCDLSVHAGERVGLVGPNGSGKSTLVRIVSGAMDPDHGTVSVRGRLAHLDQDPELPGDTVGDAIDAALAWHRDLVAAYENALGADDLAVASTLQSRLDEVGWEVGHRADAMLSRVGAPPRSARCVTLSGGERRRVALARALLGEPEVLVLDEPTNHLDADAVEWLEGWLGAYRGAVLLVTHDRYMLEAVATRIVEVEDGVTVSYDGSYADYLVTRAERRAAQEKSEDQRLAMIAREAEWASRCPAAQTVKQKARLDRLAALQASRPLLRQNTFNLDLRTGLKHGGTVVELHGVRKSVATDAGPRMLFKDAEIALRGGDRVGVLGPNGAGKSTLLRILTAQLAPDAGSVTRGPRVRAAVLDQERTGLHPTHTVFEAAGGGNDQVRVGDGWVHVASFLGRFLFGREQHHRRVDTLSGGEKARLLLAKLLLQGANLLLLDEPTNDLDLMTLRVLEEALLSYDGVVVVVTHDRAFLDRVCNAVIAVEDGTLTRYASRQQRDAARKAKDAAAKAAASAKPVAPTSTAAPASAPPARARLSFKEQKELAELPARIETLEAEQAAVQARLADPAVYKDASVDVAALGRRLDALSAEAEGAFLRWTELEERAGR